MEKRPLVFFLDIDATTLRDGTQIQDGTAEWDRVGKDEEKANEKLQLAEYLSYDEIMLGSLLGVSGPSYFINDGNRFNLGNKGQASSFEPRGMIVGLV